MRAATPDLELFDRTTSVGEPRFGDLCTLLTWHEDDAVDEAERRRNDLILPLAGQPQPVHRQPVDAASLGKG